MLEILKENAKLHITSLPTLFFFNSNQMPTEAGGGMNAPPPKDVHAPVLRRCGYVALCDKRNFAVVIKLSILRW